MPYEAPGELFAEYPTAHYVKKYKVMAPSGAKAKRTSTKRSANVTKAVKLCMERLTERKHLATSLALTPVPAAGTITNVTVMSQGTSATTRVGNQVHVNRLCFELLFGLTATSAGDLIRVIAGIDHQPDGAALTVTQVLETASPVSCYNRDIIKPRGRVSILGDWSLDMNNNAAATLTAIRHLRFEKKIDSTVLYQSNAGTISDLLKNNIFILQISNAGLTNSSGNAQIVFNDI